VVVQIRAAALVHELQVLLRLLLLMLLLLLHLLRPLQRTTTTTKTMKSRLSNCAMPTLRRCYFCSRVYCYCCCCEWQRDPLHRVLPGSYKRLHLSRLL